MKLSRKELSSISRRDFLKASGLSAGGLVIGVS
ncbi:MAG: twin-arginine translocation signal domain-containing protein, partial [Xanthomonadales bacterium]|nr:twin-arginine translocation signal domain-containing protein [Gammaproteobacteria bacterium]NNK04915.1 twin-arginine translocation signal domain-containing protein [Xanthomonadales bacterium]